jgi:hypothetical protein
MPWLQSSQHHPHNSHGKHDEVALLRLNTAIKPHSYLRVSRRFESIYNLAWGKLDNTTHVSHKDHMSGHSLRRLPNSGPYAIPRRAFMVGPHTILCASCRYVGYHPTRRPAKLLSLWNPINPICASTKSMVVPQGSTDAVPNRHRQGLPPSKLRIWKHMTLTLSIQYSPLSPNSPARSHIVAQSESERHKPHRTSIDKRALLRAVLDHSSSTDSLHN